MWIMVADTSQILSLVRCPDKRGFGLPVSLQCFTIPQRMVRHWHRLLREAGLPHPWKYSRLGWMWLGAIWDRGRGPCPWKRVGKSWCFKSLQPNPFYEFIVLAWHGRGLISCIWPIQVPAPPGHPCGVWTFVFLCTSCSGVEWERGGDKTLLDIVITQSCHFNVLSPCAKGLWLWWQKCISNWPQA